MDLPVVCRRRFSPDRIAATQSSTSRFKKQAVRMARFLFFRRGKNNTNHHGRRVHRDGAGENSMDQAHLQKGKGAFSRGDSFGPRDFTTDARNGAVRFVDEEANLNIEDWFFRKIIETDTTTTTSSTMTPYPPQRVRDLHRGPSGCGSTFEGGRDIEELAALDNSLLALAPGNQIEGLDPSSDDKCATDVRPVVVEAAQLSRRKANVKHMKGEKHKKENKEDGAGETIARNRTWGRPVSALDAVFGANKAQKPPSNEILPDETKVVRVLSVEGPDSQDSKYGMAWMRNRKYPPPVYKLKPQIESPVVARSRSGLDSTSMASATTGTSDIYTTDTVSTASSYGSGYSGDVYEDLFARTGLFLGGDNDDSEFDEELPLGVCVGPGWNPVAPCRNVAGELSYFVRELMDREIVLKDDSFLNCLTMKGPETKGGMKEQGATRSARSADYSEFS